MANFNRIKNVVSVIMVSAVLTASAYAEEIKLSTVVGGPPKKVFSRERKYIFVFRTN